MKDRGYNGSPSEATSGTAVVVFGEADRNRGIAEELLLDGLDVRRAFNSEFLRATCDSGDVELVIFGRGSDATLLRVLRELRAGAFAPAVSPNLPVLWIAQGEQEVEVLRAFEAGSDDVMRSPVHHGELLARIAALVRRAAPPAPPAMVTHRSLVIDVAAHTVTFDSHPVVLRRMEYDLLLHLARAPFRVFTKSELLTDVWGYRSTGSTRTLDSHASRLRRKLADAGATGWILNVWGVGYALCRANRTHRRQRRDTR